MPKATAAKTEAPAIRNLSPVDGRKMPAVLVTPETQVKGLVGKSRLAQRKWSALTFEQRASVMKKAGRLMLERRQELLELLHDEGGKPAGEVLMGEALGALQFITDWIKVARPFLKEKKVPISPLAFPGKSAVVQSVPRGVVGIIAPWNFPVANFFKPVFAALLCGNTVVLKPSEFAPRSGAWFVKVMGEVLPEDVLIVIQGDKTVGTALIHSGIDALTFTGSSASGRIVAKQAGELLIPCSVELGGKDAAIVLADCDLERTVAGIMHWSLTNAGQACGDIERVYVEEKIADQFVERLANAVSRLRVSGNPATSDLGPVMTKPQLEIVKEHVGDAIARGAKVVCGGKPTGKGLYFEPTVIDHCADPEMLVLTEPTFGPVIPIVRVQNADQAVTLSNKCEYGLNASVWSKNLKKADMIARQLEVGTAFINNHAFTGAIPAAAWGGVKKTGAGIANSTFALHHYTRPRTVVLDKNSKPDAWWLPMDSVLEELGNRLAEAQVGNVLAAVKVPLLLAQRQKTVMKFVKSAAPAVTQLPRAKATTPRPFSSLRIKVRGALEKGFEALQPALTAAEKRWGRAASMATFSGVPGAALQPLPVHQAEEAVEDVYDALPFPANAGYRATLWAVGLAPVVLKRKLQLFDQLPPEEQQQILKGFAKSDSYLLRQVALLIKTTGSFSHVSTTRFHAAVPSVRG